MQDTQIYHLERRIQDEKKRLEEIILKISQEKTEFLSIMGKNSLDEVKVSYMNMESLGEQLQLKLSLYKEQARDLEQAIRHVGAAESLTEKLNQKLSSLEALSQKNEIHSLLSQDLKQGDEW